MKYLFIFFLWFSSTALSFNFSEEFEKAVVAKQQHDWDSALIHLKNVASQQPDYLPARVMLVETYLRSFQTENALTNIEVAEQLGGDSNLLAVMRGSAYRQMNAVDKAIEAIGSIDNAERKALPAYWQLQLLGIRLANRDYQWAESYLSSLSKRELDAEPSLYLEWANLYYHTGRSSKAIELLQGQTFPDEIKYKVLLLLGELNLLEGYPLAAEKDYIEALKLNPDELNVLMAVTRFYLQHSSAEKALEYSKKLINRYPSHPVAQLLHAGVLKQLGDDKRVSDVIRELNYMLSSLNQEAQHQQHLLMFKALLSYFSENWLQTKQTMETYVSLYPFDKVANLLMLKACFQLNDYGCARTRVQLGVANNQSDKTFVLLAMQLYRVTKEYDKAVHIAELGLGVLPNDQEITFALALLHQSNGDRRRAIARLSSLPNQNEDKVLLTLGYLLLQNNQLDQATKTANQLLKLYTGKVESFLFSAEVAIAVGDRNLAQQLIQQALLLDEFHRPSLMLKASIELAVNRLNDAYETYEVLLNNNPNDEHVLLLMSALNKKQNKFAAAQNTLEKVLSLNSQNDLARAELLAILLSFERYREAFELAQEFTARHQTDAKILEMKLKAELLSRQYDKAKWTLTHLTDLAFNDPELILRVSGYYMQVGDYKRAGNYLGRAKQLDTGARFSIDILRQEANLAFRTGKEEELYELIARLDYLGQKEAALELMAYQQIKSQNWLEAKVSLKGLLSLKSERKYYFLMVDTLSRLGQFIDAQQYLKSWLELSPDDSEARLRLSSMQHNDGKRSDAIRTLEQTSDLYNQPILLNNLANLYLPDSPNKAVEYAYRAVQIAPETPALMDTLGWAYILDRRLELGLQYIRDAIARDSTNPEHYYHLAYALTKLGKYQQAKSALEELRKLDKQQNFAKEYDLLIKELKK